METIEAYFIVFFWRPVTAVLKSKIGILAIIVLVVIIIVTGRINSKPQKAYDSSIPTITQAPTLIETNTRAYYAKDFSDNGKVLTLNTFYYFDSGRWQLSKKPLPLDRKFEPVRVTKR